MKFFSIKLVSTAKTDTLGFLELLFEDFIYALDNVIIGIVQCIHITVRVHYIVSCNVNLVLNFQKPAVYFSQQLF